MAGENGKVQLGIGAGRRRGKGVEKCGGIEVALIVRRLANVRLRSAQFGSARGHVRKFSAQVGSGWRWERMRGRQDISYHINNILIS